MDRPHATFLTYNLNPLYSMTLGKLGQHSISQTRAMIIGANVTNPTRILSRFVSFVRPAIIYTTVMPQPHLKQLKFVTESS